MPLNLPDLKIDIKKAFTDARGLDNVDDAMDLVVERLAIAIDKFVRTGLVTTVGNSTDQTGNIT